MRLVFPFGLILCIMLSFSPHGGWDGNSEGLRFHGPKKQKKNDGRRDSWFGLHVRGWKVCGGRK